MALAIADGAWAASAARTWGKHHASNVEVVAAHGRHPSDVALVLAMSGERRRDGSLDVGMENAVAIEAQLASLSAGELAPTVREELEQYGRASAPEDLVGALCVVSAGFLRTGPMMGIFPEEAKEGVVAGFVRAFSTAPEEGGPFGLVRQFLADAFHQRELPAPPPVSLDVLHRITVGLMMTKGLSTAVAAQLAMADWMASVYLAGTESW